MNITRNPMNKYTLPSKALLNETHKICWNILLIKFWKVKQVK